MWSSFSIPFVIFLICSILVASPIADAGDQFEWDGRVLELDQSNFDAAISNFDYIFVDFYAPWCGHCKRLAPELDKAATMLAGLKPPVVVAKIDADKYKSIASKHEIDGYPTLKIFIHGVASEYFGPRKADVLTQFLKKFVAPDVAILESDFAIKEFVKEAGSDFPIFIGFGLNETLISDSGVKYKKKAWFSVARYFSDDIMSSYDFDKVPALAAIHPAYNEQNIFYGPFEENFIQDYIKQSLLPLVLPITQDSLRLLKDEERKTVLTIFEDEKDEKTFGLVKVLKAAASANRDLIFGYVGRRQWADFVESFDVSKSQLPKMVVWDRGEEYTTVIGSESVDMDEKEIGTQVSNFLKNYREGNVIHNRISGPSVMGFLKSKLGMQVILILILVLLLVALMVSMLKDEPDTFSNQDSAVETGSSSAPQYEPRVPRRATEKED